MKILYIYNTLAIWGGIERILVDKMNYLVSTYKYDVYIITTDQGNHKIPYHLDKRVHHLDLNIRFHSIYTEPIYQRPFLKIRLQKLFEKKFKETLEFVHPDIIIGIADIFVKTILKTKGSIPFIVESHSMKKYTATLGYRSMYWWEEMLRQKYLSSIKSASALVTLTNGDANDWDDIKHAVVIPNLVHLNESGKLSTCENEKIIFVGRFAVQKGINYLIKVWEIVHCKYPKWELNFYGEGEDKDKYLKLINSYKDKLNINVCSPTSLIFDKYLESSIFLLTSIYEPFGLVLPEAMSCGLPVISFNCPYGPADIIKDGEDGFLIDSYNISAMAEKIIYLIENPELRKKMGMKAYINSNKYAANKIMPQWIKLFESMPKKN